MSVIGSNILAGASGNQGYFLTNSLRFRSSASAYLNRTPASAGNKQIFTVSFWLKTAKSNFDYYLFEASTDGGNNERTVLAFNSGKLQFRHIDGGSAVLNLETTQVFRDPSAWYHIVLAVDTTQATSTNRVKFYVNGSQITAFGTASYPTQNLNTDWNGANAHSIGSSTVPDSYADMYLAEFYNIDGQALTPSSFGETSTTTGVWIPKKYTGTYGTNGFYLPFTDVAITSGSNAGLGKDFSGNANYWNTNNISVTTGTTYDSMNDVPTLTSATTANYCVLNPLSQGTSGNTNNGNLSYNNTSTVAWNGVRASFIIPKTGEWYWEAYILATPMDVSIVAATANLNSSGYNDTYSYSYGALNAAYRYSGIDQGTVATYTAGDTIAYYINAGVVNVYKNNTLIATWSQNLSAYSGDYFPAVFTNSTSANNGVALNFGQQPFKYTPPSNAVALNTYNLPTPTIGATASTTANKYMDATLYTGNGSAGTDVQTITNSGSFQPDLVWTKSRSNAVSHHIGDSVRGIDKTLFSNSTSAEGTYTYDIHAFNSNGFTVGNDGTQNTSGYTYVAWQWRASNATAVTNTDGSITSTVSANTTAGFSIVTYTGTGSVATIGHGLGVKPSMIFFKVRSNGTYGWYVYNSVIGATNHLVLNTTAASSSSSFLFNDTEPTSTVMTVGTSVGTNQSGQTFVAYCFAPIAGYSAFGSYTGNGSSDGTFVYTGFRPRFVMIKCSSSDQGGNAVWVMLDTARNTYNVTNNRLKADSSTAEDTSPWLDINSNGFKIRETSTSVNGSSATYIYMAFAEVPQKFSLGR